MLKPFDKCINRFSIYKIYIYGYNIYLLDVRHFLVSKHNDNAMIAFSLFIKKRDVFITSIFLQLTPIRNLQWIDARKMRY